MSKLRYIVLCGCLSISGLLLGQAPIITSVDFVENVPGVNVILAGSGFSTNTSQMAVLFGGVAGVVTASTALNVEVTAPANAKFDNVTVLNLATGLSATSKFKYFTSFSGDTFDPSLFTSTYTFSTTVTQQDLCVCDFNNNGKNDIVTTKIAIPSVGPRDITLYQNTSTGIGDVNFLKKDGDELTALEIGEPTRNIICGDVNNDGKPDLIMSGNLSGNRNKIHILLNNSTTEDVSFQNKITLLIPDGTTAIRLAVQDLNGDGRSEIAVADRENNKVFVFKNTSSGSLTFDSPVEIIVPGAQEFWGLEVQDMDGDGKADIVLNQFQDNNVYILKNASTASAFSFDQVTTIDLPISIRNLKTAYIDTDGRLDIVVTHENADQISIIQNNSVPNNMSFDVLGQWDTSSGSAPWGIDMADVEGDGDLDIFIGNKDVNLIDVFVNNSSGSDITLQKESITTSLGVRNLALADFDGDAKPDLVITNSAPDSSPKFPMEVWRNSHCFIPHIIGETSRTICDQELKLVGTPSSGGGVIYEWFKNGAGAPEKSSTENFIIIYPGDIVASTEYQLRSTDSDGCVQWSAETITIVPNGGAVPPVPVIVMVPEVCEGEDVTLMVQSPDNVNLTYDWTGPDDFSATGSSVVVTNFISENVGKYVLTASSGPCLSGETSIIVNKKGLPLIDISASGATTFCAGTTITLSANNTGIISGYKWFDATGELGTNATFSVDNSGDYFAEVIADGCTVTTNTINVVVFEVPVANFTPSKTEGCTGEEITFTNTSTVDGNATVIYDWDFGDGTSSDLESPTHVFSSASSSTVSLNVSYSGVTCLDMSSTTININEPEVLSISAAQTSICPEEELELSIDTNFTNISWTSGEATSTITITGGGTHDVSAADINSCNVSASIVIDELEIPVITVTPTEISINNGQSVTLEASGADTFLWSPMDGLNDPTIANPIASPELTTLYTVVGTETGVCSGSAEVNVTVLEGRDQPAKVLAINGTSDLASWQIINAAATSCALSIFNRNGAKVFEGNGNVVEWDGTNGGNELPQGTYFYVFTCDDDQPKTGSILLMKL